MVHELASKIENKGEKEGNRRQKEQTCWEQNFPALCSLLSFSIGEMHEKEGSHKKFWGSRGMYKIVVISGQPMEFLLINHGRDESYDLWSLHSAILESLKQNWMNQSILEAGSGLENPAVWLPFFWHVSENENLSLPASTSLFAQQIYETNNYIMLIIGQQLSQALGKL